jgi:hypothetical protein
MSSTRLINDSSGTAHIARQLASHNPPSSLLASLRLPDEQASIKAPIDGYSSSRVLDIIRAKDWQMLASQSNADADIPFDGPISPLASYQQWTIISNLLAKHRISAEHLFAIKGDTASTLNTLNSMAVWMVKYEGNQSVELYLSCANIFMEFIRQALVTTELMEQSVNDHPPTLYCLIQLAFRQPDDDNDIFKVYAVNILRSLMDKMLITPVQLAAEIKNPRGEHKHISILYYIHNNKEYNCDFVSTHLNFYCLQRITQALKDNDFLAIKQWLNLSPLLMIMINDFDFRLLQQILSSALDNIAEKTFSNKIKLVCRYLHWNDAVEMQNVESKSDDSKQHYDKDMEKRWGEKAKPQNCRDYIKHFLMAEIGKCELVEELDAIQSYLKDPTLSKQLRDLFTPKKFLYKHRSTDNTEWDRFLTEIYKHHTTRHAALSPPEPVIKSPHA